MALPGIVIEGGVNIEAGIKFGSFPAVPSLALSLDAANYSGSGPWIDTVSSKSFTLYNSPTWSNSIGGGSFLFTPASSQYAASTSGVGSLSSWSVEVWHYYTGNNSSGSPCIVTEVWPNPAANLNFNLGTLDDNSPDLQAGLFGISSSSSSSTHIHCQHKGGTHVTMDLTTGDV